MTKNIYENYQETEVLNADPLKLVCVLYRAAMEATAAARRHLQAGQIRERSRRINKAWAIIHELRRALSHEQGGEISSRLSALYAYMQGRLIEANVRQADAPLAEVEVLLATLAEAWSAIGVPRSALPEQVYEPVCCAC